MILVMIEIIGPNNTLDEQIDYEAFQNLSENTIVNLLKSYRKGVIVKFLMKHKQWKESIKIENSTGSETATSSKKVLKTNIFLDFKVPNNFLLD